MKISPLSLKDCKELSKLHRDSLPYTTSSKLGMEYLICLYRSIAKNKKTNHALVAKEKNRKIAFVCATTDLAAFNSKVLKELTMPAIIEIIKSLLSFKLSLLELIKRIQFENKLIKNFKKNYATITILYTSESLRRNGIATKLINEILKFYKSKIDFIYVDTVKANEPALKLYYSTGFRKQKELDDSILLIFNTKNGNFNEG